MGKTNLNKNLTEILKDKYIVPLYQRNFAWGVEEIGQLLQDVYESFINNPKGNYFIGSLIVLKRNNGDYEVIDGQQRLTAITLIAKILGLEEIKEPKMFYDSRPEVEAFFNSFYRTGNTNDVTFDHKVSHFVNAVDIINETKLKPDNENRLAINSPGNDLQSFKEFFFKNVIIVRVEIPEDTDVANYFEIMNNRGEQLQKHEILKAKLLDKIKNEKGEYGKNLQAIFAKIWDACSQIDIHIQKLFTSSDREIYFGDNYNCFSFQAINNIENQTDETFTISENQNTVTIDTILHSTISDRNTNEDKDKYVDDEGEDKSIIDFPNFLMHVFKILYNGDYRNATKDEKNKFGLDIPLNEKDLLTVFAKIESKIDSMAFISKLLYFRTVFDRYILKATIDEKSEDEYYWSLEMPYKYTYDKKQSLKYKNTFDKQKRILKCLSMLQVTYRTRIYKNWLQEVLGWFTEPANFNITSEDFQKRLDELVCKYFNDNMEYHEITKDKYYSKGTNTPHFLFNFIDYLYWVESANKIKNNIADIKYVNDFEFKYRNSIEHHLPQSFLNSQNQKCLDCLGNLCLVSKSSNSKMNNEAPSGKADEKGKYYRKNLPPKQKIIYDITNSNKSWGENEISQHYYDVVILLEKRKDILGINDELII